MDSLEIKNAIIEGVSLTDSDHGCLSAWVNLDLGGSVQGFGGYTLYIPNAVSNNYNRYNYAGLFIWRCMEIAGVSRWEDLPGKTVRAKATCTKVHAIGHIIKDIWFDPYEEFLALQTLYGG